MPTPRVLDRDPERNVLAAFLEGSWPAALRIRGAPGIGKSVLVEHAIAEARAAGIRVLSCHPVEAEAQIPFTSVADLVHGLEPQIRELPPPQREALAHALVWRGGGAPLGTRAVGFALATLLRTIAERQRVLVVIDDLHWLDADSARSISFGVRRASGDRVGLLGALRTDLEHGVAGRLFAPIWDEQLSFDLGPLPPEALAALLRTRFGEDLSLGLLSQVHAAAAGNPLLAQRLAGELARTAWVAPADRLPLPEDLRALLLRQLDDLPSTAHAVCLAAAALAEPTADILARAVAVDDEAAAIGLLVERGILRRAGRRIRFGHPLMASAIYTNTPPRQRRTLHRQLARVVDAAEERARHLAHGAEGPDEAVAAAVLEGARVARARGAPGAAADLAIWAARLTPPRDRSAATDRTRIAASYLRDAGDIPRARRLLAEAVPAAPRSRRASLLVSLAGLQARTDGPRAALGILDMAERQDPGDARLLARVATERTWLHAALGELDAAVDSARAAREAADSVNDPTSRSRALIAAAWVGFTAGWPDAEVESLLTRATADSGARLGLVRPALVRALLALRIGRIAAARPVLARAERELIMAGAEAPLPYVLVPLAELELLAGRWPTARGYASDAVELIVVSGQAGLRPWAVGVRALVAAHGGDLAQAKADAEGALAEAEWLGLEPAADLNRAVLAFVALSSDDAAAAVAALEPCITRAPVTEEPAARPWVPDAAEALVGVGRLDDANELLAPFERAASQRDRPLLRLGSTRARALWLSASGAPDAGIDLLDQTLKAAERLVAPFDIARVRLVLGTILHAAGNRLAAQTALQHARDAFDSLGAPAWVALADGKAAAALHGRRTTYTDVEQQVIDFVLEGHTTRGIAARLYMSPRTVEAHLTAIYRKAGVRGRTELVRQILTNSGH